MNAANKALQPTVDSGLVLITPDLADTLWQELKGSRGIAFSHPAGMLVA